MNTAQLTGQFEFDRDRTENLHNGKGPNKAGHQLARTLLNGQIAGGKPHFLTTNIPGGPDPVTLAARRVRALVRHNADLTLLQVRLYL